MASWGNLTLEELLGKHDRLLWHMAHKYNIDGYTVEDLHQEFSMVLIECYKRFDPSKGSKFRTYLYGSIMHEVYKLLARQKQTYESLDAIMAGDDNAFLEAFASEEDDPDTVDFQNVVYEHLGDVLDSLGRDGEMSALLIFEDKTFAEVGAIFGLSKQRVQQIHVRNLAHLRKEYGKIENVRKKLGR